MLSVKSTIGHDSELSLAYRWAKRIRASLHYTHIASKLHKHSVDYTAKLVHTRYAPPSTITNSHQEPVSGQACNYPDPH